jgi:IS5 family transposase
MAYTQSQIEQKQKEVHEAYGIVNKFGYGKARYETLFDELATMRKAKMADDFRNARGLPQNAKTPYDEK